MAPKGGVKGARRTTLTKAAKDKAVGQRQARAAEQESAAEEEEEEVDDQGVLPEKLKRCWEN